MDQPLKYVTNALSLIGVMLMIAGWYFQHVSTVMGGGMLIMLGLITALFIPSLSGYRFTFWILIANLAAMLRPELFDSVGGFSLTNEWLLLILVQLIMFGMGTQMRLSDFAHVAEMPYGVLVGLLCQFTIMPLLGYAMAILFQFPPEIGAGLVLIGSCSSGLASNVMTYLAKGNLALSVTITALATALAPILTPMWMKVLAGAMVEVEALKMGLDIVKLVLVPILAAFVHDFMSSKNVTLRFVFRLLVILSFAYLAFLIFGGWNWLLANFQIFQPIEVELTAEDYKQQLAGYLRNIGFLSLPGFVAAAFAFGALYHVITLAWKDVVRWMPLLSMFGIVYFTLVATAKGRDNLLEVGMMLVLAVLLHNVLGYVLGYWGGRAFGLNRQDARTIAIEVGSQNGAMATGLAKTMGQLATVGLAAVIFAPLMNVTGSIIANYWAKSAPVPPLNTDSK